MIVTATMITVWFDTQGDTRTFGDPLSTRLEARVASLREEVQVRHTSSHRQPVTQLHHARG
jgi:hypothetical protein